MNLNPVKFILSLGATLVIIILLNTRFGSIPEVGPFFSPFQGFWQHAEQKGERTDQEIIIPDLTDDVSIHYDEYGIPHIFAENDRDLYKAQGYIVAKERLWQMEFMTYAAAGRLTELVGEEALGHSRQMRNLGMMIGAENAVESMKSDEHSRLFLEAFAEGVNHYINNLNPRELPLEYKIIGHEPEEWTPLKTALILMNISHTLTGGSSDYEMTNTLDALGKDFINRFFPKYSDDHEYYIPDEGQFDFDPVSVTPPDTGFVPEIMEDSPVELPDPGIGSNNWTVHGSRTESGSPMMSNDPHLGLSLPSIWMEMQLHTPDLNVYGVTIPGAPGIIIGFNESLSWGVTNAGSDVMDVYEIEFRDDNFSEYKYDGEWHPLEKREEIYEMPDGSTHTDTLLITRHGPVTTPPDESPLTGNSPEGHAIRWVAQEPGNELLALNMVNRAESISEFKDALTHYHVPAQTFAYADTAGNIGLFHHGKFPARWQGQGDFISDGRDPAHEWQDWIPMDQTPRVINPDRGFAGSANQNPVGQYYPYPLGWGYASNERGIRVHEMLEAEDSVDLTFMQKMLHDDHSVEARRILPYLLEWIREDELGDEHLTVLEILEEWNFNYDPNSKAAYFFDRWWQSLHDEIWSAKFSELNRNVRKPNRERTALELIEHPDDEIWTGENHEDLYDLVTEVFLYEYDRMTNQYGTPGDDWQWQYHQGTRLDHLANITGFGATDLSPGGSRLSLNATGENWGPSWRMIVDLSEPVQAWGMFPGGVSGNPASYYYDNFVHKWESGELRKLLFWNSEEQAQPDFTLQLINSE